MGCARGGARTKRQWRTADRSKLARMDRSERASRARDGIAAFSAALAGLCFGQVVTLGFAYDDGWTLVSNRALSRPLGFLMHAVLWGTKATAAIADSTRPTMVASMWIERRLFGTNPSGFHASSLVLYAACCAVASLVLLALTRRTRLAVAGGAFFAVAPLHAEPVAAVNYREDLFAGLGVMIALAWLFHPRARPERWRTVVLVAGAWLVGLLGKESAVALVPLFAGLALLRRPDRAWWVERKRSLIALGIVLVAWGAWRSSLRLRGVDDVPLARSVGLAAKLLATARYEVQALVSSVAPFGWSPEYDPQGPAGAAWLLPLAVAVAATVWLARRRDTLPLALGIAVSLLAALPTSPLLGPANERADRFLFVSVLGGALIWGWAADRGVSAIRARWRNAPRVLGTAFGGAALLLPLLVPLAALSQEATAAWKNDFTLWSVAARRAPGSYRTWVGLARAQRQRRDLDAAERSVDRALELFPDSLSAHVTRAYNRISRGDLAGARADIQRVRDLGGPRQRGLKRAAQCAEMDVEAAKRCVDGR
jgi:hypothetical protein